MVYYLFQNTWDELREDRDGVNRAGLAICRHAPNRTCTWGRITLFPQFFSCCIFHLHFVYIAAVIQINWTLLSEASLFVKRPRSCQCNISLGVTGLNKVIFFFLIFKLFYCCSFTVVCIFSPPLYPTPAKPISLPCFHPPLWFCPCVLHNTTLVKKARNVDGLKVIFLNK